MDNKLQTIKQTIGSALVIGGGIGGVQAALDLAECGIKVYLVDSGPSIGGVMAQLDKTFPTNDCAMCTLAPRLVDCGRHPNIEIITQAEIKELRGEAGNFTVSINKKPRFVDLSKCTGCGICVENCPVKYKIYLEPEERIKIELSSEDIEKMGKIIDEYRNKKGTLVPILHEINAEYRYLPEDVLRYISEELDIPLSLIYQIATFYDAFSLTKKGLYIIKVCFGTACYIKGGDTLLAAFERELGIKNGETTHDQRFSLETVSCLGCCGQAPVLTVNEELYGHMTQVKVKEVLKEYD